MAAGYTLSANFIGFEDLRKNILEGSSIAKVEMSKALNKAANDLQNQAVSLAPKKKGKLKSSIHTQYANSNNLVAKVGTNVVYAAAQEFGTVGMTINVPDGRRINKRRKSAGRTRPYTFIGNIQPKFYMKQAFENIKRNMSMYMQTAATTMVQRMAGK